MKITDFSLPNLEESQVKVPGVNRFCCTHSTHKPGFLLLYGSLRNRSFSRLNTEQLMRRVNQGAIQEAENGAV